MKLQLQSGDLSKQSTPCLVIGMFSGSKSNNFTQSFDKKSKQSLDAALKSGDISGQAGQTLLLYKLNNFKAERILVVGLGEEKLYDSQAFVLAMQNMCSQLTIYSIEAAICGLTAQPPKERDAQWAMQQAGQHCTSSQYYFDYFKSEKQKRHKIKTISYALPAKARQAQMQRALEEGQAIAKGMAFTKDLANTPPNVCNPSFLVEQAKALAKKHKNLKIKALSEREMKKLKMGSLLSVSQGSPQPGYLICMHYKPPKSNKAPLVFVGKGVTFDTGGNSLKPAASMVDMKYDMCGAATVMGLMRTIAELKLPVHVIGICGAVENTPGGPASRPDDVVTSMSGQTIEILNTDAEGRLVLCDALTYCEQFKPDVVVDIATLTGACVIALGEHRSAVYSNDEKLATELKETGEQCMDHTWQMPLDKAYDQLLNSNVADMANIGGRAAGSITAACFLARFTKKLRWAHLDVAGTAYTSGKERHATGRPLPLLANYVLSRCR